MLIQPGDPPPPTPEVLLLWEEARRHIPRLYNGPVLSVTSIDVQRGIIHCRRDTYQRLIVQPRINTGTRQLSITVVLTAPGPDGRPHILLGRRSAETRMYGNLWELGPSGGVEPPETAELSHEQLTAEALREVAEETHLDVQTARTEAIGITYDPLARSYDIILRLMLETLPAVQPRGWEYTRIAWFPLHTIRQYVPTSQLIPPSRLLLEVLATQEC